MGFIAEAKRKNLWFGTEEKMEWFKTPSRGADTSPAGWDSEGVTLNGGGYVFNSFGSHKQYQFDWGSSNAREVAQKMKSYADGTYGRGYIYFVDPTIYDHNVLPAHWADPSMGIDYEGNSIVAGVDPVGVPTGANSNDLPVQAAQFNLNTIPVGFRGKAQAVYVPIPEGHTLSLGAMYSFTGSGGVFASPVLLTGAIAAPQKLTTLGVNTSDVVADTFSGVRGVWLWVGKTAAGNSTVTIHGLIGRLMTDAGDTSYVIAENLFTNPNLVGDGTWAEVAWNKLPASIPSTAWQVQPGTSGVVTTDPNYLESGFRGYYCRWDTVPTGGNVSIFPANSSGSIVTVTPGEVIPISAKVINQRTKVRLFAEWYTSAGAWIAPAGDSGFVTVTNDPANPTLISVVTDAAPANAARLYVRVMPAIAEMLDGDRIVVGEVMIGHGVYFNGSTTPETAVGVDQPEDFRWRWLGTPNASESVMEIERADGVATNNCIAGVSTRAGKPAIRLIPTNSFDDSFARFIIPAAAHGSGTLMATQHKDAPITGSRAVYANRLRAQLPSQDSSAAPNVAGSFPLRFVFSGLTSLYYAILSHGGAQGSGDVWWTDIGLFAGDYDGPAFSGSSPQNGTTHYRWTGTPDNSTSEAYYVSNRSVDQKRGPWVGGMGHGGCRFVGKPTFIENGPNWTGLSATFKEVVN